MRVSTAQIFDHGVRGMQNNQAALLKIQNQVNTGRRILTPEDDPVGASQALVVAQSKQVNAMYLENQATSRSQLGYLESNLNSVGDELQNILERAIQGGNDSLGAGDRKMIATELQSRLDGLLALANAEDGTGKYLYSGFQAQVKPFAINSVAPNPIPPVLPGATAAYDLLTNTSVKYLGDDGQRQLQVSSSVDMKVSVPGSDLFMRIKDGSGEQTQRSMFDAVNNMINFLTEPPTMLPAAPVPVPPQTQAEADAAALLAGKAASRARYDQSLGDLQSSLDNVLQVRSTVGAQLNQLDSLSNMGEDLNLQYDQRLSELQDLDYAKALSDLSQWKLQLEAAQATFVKISGLSLFNYL